MSDRICFVLMGFGIKPDYRTGRQLDLDKTFEYLIKPVFDDLNITCVRACDIPHSGVIDSVMYEYILKADIVVADISTANANAIYELGVRHALRPHTTIVIAEKELPYPFDLNHIVITSYEHLGKDIGASEARRFYKELKKLVEVVLTKQSKVDSPVYTYLAELNPPFFTREEKARLKALIEEVKTSDGPAITVPELLKEADEFRKNNQFDKALEKLEEAGTINPNEPSVIQRKALITYKSKLPNPTEALKTAEKILAPLHPDNTTDPETLGLLGAINKRLYELTGLGAYLQKALGYYQRGFIICQDYYNGINLAFLYLLSAANATDESEKIADRVNAARTRLRTKDICLQLASSPNFTSLPDKVWILLTLAEIENVEGNTEKTATYLETARAEGASPFDIDSFTEQQEKLKPILQKADD